MLSLRTSHLFYFSLNENNYPTQNITASVYVMIVLCSCNIDLLFLTVVALLIDIFFTENMEILHFFFILYKNVCVQFFGVRMETNIKSCFPSPEQAAHGGLPEPEGG